MNKKQLHSLLRIIISAMLTAIGFILLARKQEIYFYLPCFVLASLTVGYTVIIGAFNGLFHGHILDENFLMMLGSAGAFILGDYAEGTVILLLYQIGELFQSIATHKSRKSISQLMDLRAEYANIEVDGAIVQVDPYEVELYGTIHILPGEKIPIDCAVISGESEIDTSALTGESLPRSVSTGDELLSGCVNLSGTLICKTLKSFEDSAVSSILNMIEGVAAKKSTTESFVTRFAKYYTPTVVLAAAALFIIPSLITGDYGEWLYRAITFLVVSCPCALVVSVPLTFFGAIGGASKKGILIKGNTYIEALSKAGSIAFDKTGTLTKGIFEVAAVHPNKISAQKLLEMAAICEYHSPHPIAASLKGYLNEKQPLEQISDYRVESGKGVCCKYEGIPLLAGNGALMEENGIKYTADTTVGTAVYVAYGGEFLGSIAIGDTLKASAADTVTQLKGLGFKTYMLTGDKLPIAEKIALEGGIDSVFAELLPDKKVEALEKIMTENPLPAVYVGDGINDAPVLSRADIGISMGQIGSDAAIEASDIVIMNDDISLLPTAVEICKKAMRISKQNIAFSITVKFGMLLLSALGISNIYMAVFADVGVLILAILNSLRTMLQK